MGKSKVSICIPVYNGQEYLADTLQSVLDQTHTNFEILIQNNCSSDRTSAIVSDFMLIDARIKYQENKHFVSMAANWNHAIQRATGEFVVLLSADDLLKPKFLEECLIEFNKDKVLDIVTANHNLVENGNIRKRKIQGKPGKRNLSCNEILLKNPFSINFTLFRKSYLKKIFLTGGALFREPFYTCDYDLWLRSSLIGAVINYIDKPLATYRVHQESLSSNKLKMIKHTLLVLDLNRKKLISGGCWINYKVVILRLLARTLFVYVRSGVFNKRLFFTLASRVIN